MGTLLYFFAPIFLTPSPALLPPIAMQVDEAGEEAAEAADQAAPEEPAAEEAPAEEAPVAETTEAAPTPEETAQAAPAGDDEALEAQLRQRETMRTIHRAFGVATWVAMGAAVVIGSLHFHDEYAGGSVAETPCAQGTPVLSPDFCFYNAPYPMLVSGAIAAVLYATTFTLSFTMPDPLGVAEAPGWAGERLRIHKALRWAHLAGMLATTIFGAIAANIPMDPMPGADFGIRQAMAAVHLGLGVTTWALLTAAAAVILF